MYYFLCAIITASSCLPVSMNSIVDRVIDATIHFPDSYHDQWRPTELIRWKFLYCPEIPMFLFFQGIVLVAFCSDTILTAADDGTFWLCRCCNLAWNTERPLRICSVSVTLNINEKSNSWKIIVYLSLRFISCCSLEFLIFFFCLKADALPLVRSDHVVRPFAHAIHLNRILRVRRPVKSSTMCAAPLPELMMCLSNVKWLKCVCDNWCENLTAGQSFSRAMRWKMTAARCRWIQNGGNFQIACARHFQVPFETKSTQNMNNSRNSFLLSGGRWELAS